MASEHHEELQPQNMPLSLSLLLKGCSTVTNKQRHIKVILVTKSLRVQVGARAVPCRHQGILIMFWASWPGHPQWLHVVGTGMVSHIVVQLMGSNEWCGELQCPLVNVIAAKVGPIRVVSQKVSQEGGEVVAVPQHQVGTQHMLVHEAQVEVIAE